jgi:hypothetical protein
VESGRRWFFEWGILQVSRPRRSMVPEFLMQGKKWFILMLIPEDAFFYVSAKRTSLTCVVFCLFVSHSAALPELWALPPSLSFGRSMVLEWVSFS